VKFASLMSTCIRDIDSVSRAKDSLGKEFVPLKFISRIPKTSVTR